MISWSVTRFRGLQILCRGIGLRHRQAALHRVRILAEHTRQRLHSFVRRAGAYIEPAQRVVKLRVGWDRRPRSRAFEIGDRVANARRSLGAVPLA